MCMVFTGMRWRLNPPAMCIRHPMSLATIVICAAFANTVDLLLKYAA